MDSKKILRFAIVGCGRISKRHSQLLAESQIKGASLVSVADKNINKAKELGEKYYISFYQDMNEMMENEIIDVVVVLTESGNHAKHVTELAKYGKHIVVEKPMALTLRDADKMIMACDKHKIKLFVIKQN